MIALRIQVPILLLCHFQHAASKIAVLDPTITPRFQSGGRRKGEVKYSTQKLYISLPLTRT